MTITDVVKDSLNANDRCDAECSAQAYVRVTGVTGELMFCSHHYNKVMSDSTGHDRMADFAYETLDERHKLIQNRLIGDNV